MSTTNIEWTDRVWNPVTGCTKVSAGCKNCYAETIADRFWATQYEPIEIVRYDTTICSNVTEARPRKFTDVLCHEDRLEEPLHWRKASRVFVNSMSDLFHEAVPDEFVDRVFAVMALCQQHTFQILTKRPERMHRYFDTRVTRHIIGAAAAGISGKRDGWMGKCQHDVCNGPWPLPNVWLGVSCENQQTADERIPLLLQTPAAVRFISAEPLLGPIDLKNIESHPNEMMLALAGITWSVGPRVRVVRKHPRLDWVIVGGESGPGARGFDLAWARKIVAQCQAAGVSCFVKQVGASPYEDRDAGQIANPGKLPTSVYLRDRKGGDMSEWPEDLRVRQFPASREAVQA